MGMEILIPLIGTALSGGMTAYNTNKTAKKQDNALALQIRNQGRKQQEIDARVNSEVDKLKGSTSEDEIAKRLDQYGSQLRRNRAGLEGGLTPNIGSDEFRSDSANAAQAVQTGTGQVAGLMARMDAPGMQRQGENASFGHLATDTSLLAREAQGQDFIDRLRLAGIRRNPWIDMGAGLVGAAGSAFGGAGGGSPSWNGQALPGATTTGAPSWGALGLGGGRGVRAGSLTLPGMNGWGGG